MTFRAIPKEDNADTEISLSYNGKTVALLPDGTGSYIGSAQQPLFEAPPYDGTLCVTENGTNKYESVWFDSDLSARGFLPHVTLLLEEPVLSPLHSTGTPEALNEKFSVAGVVSLWGCIFSPDMIDADENTPVCLIHGGKDKILPADSGFAFSIPGLPYAYGSQVIADRLKKLGTSSFEFHLLEQESHAFYFKYLCIYQLDALKFDNCFQIAREFMRRKGGL